MKKIAAPKPPRCRHLDKSNRRCRKLVSDPESGLCNTHTAAQAEPDLSADLTAGLEEFTSPATINNFLSRLLLLLSQNRISARRAAVLAYITNQILHTVAAIEREAAKTPTNIEYVINIPRSQHDEPTDPQPPCP
jgi:hypothetical protein